MAGRLRPVRLPPHAPLPLKTPILVDRLRHGPDGMSRSSAHCPPTETLDRSGCLQFAGGHRMLHAGHALHRHFRLHRLHLPVIHHVYKGLRQRHCPLPLRPSISRPSASLCCRTQSSPAYRHRVYLAILNRFAVDTEDVVLFF